MQKVFTAQRVFTDREISQEVFFNAVHAPQTNTQYRILNFHGIGGQGKTALCEQFTLTFIALDATPDYERNLGWKVADRGRSFFW